MRSQDPRHLGTLLTPVEAARRSRVDVSVIAAAVRAGDLRETASLIRSYDLDLWRRALCAGRAIARRRTISVRQLIDDSVELLADVDEAV